MKYRRLYPEELKQVEQEFIQFLAANSITGPDWEQLKKVNKEKADEVVDIFSDAVWSKILGNVKFLEERGPTELRVYHFDSDAAEAIVVRLQKEGLRFDDPENIRGLSEGTLDLMSYDPEILKGKKKYAADREREIFEMMERGAKPCKEVFWRSMKKLMVSK